jgi:FkbM family methyltransferase
MIAPPGCGFWAAALAAGAWEETLRETALALTPGRAVAVDAGAHVGAWTVALAEIFERVTAFEPCAENRACLARNLAGIPNVAVLPQALSDAAGVLHLALAEPQGNSGQRIVSAAGERVDAARLDDLDLAQLDFLKLDIEGWELPALVGAQETIRRCRPTVVIEESVWSERHGLPRHGARGFLIGLGYRVAAAFPDDVVMVPA